MVNPWREGQLQYFNDMARHSGIISSSIIKKMASCDNQELCETRDDFSKAT